MPNEATLGQFLVNAALPEDMRDYRRQLDKKGLAKLLSEIAQRYPRRYRDISFKLSQIGKDAAFTTGGNSFGPEHLRRAASASKRREQVQADIDAILDDDSLSDEQRDQRLVVLAGRQQLPDREEILQESLAEKNPLSLQLKGAGRGNDMNLASLRGSDWLYQDHRDRTIPIPVTRSYSQGLNPLEYWAGTYGARQGVMATKFATQQAGFLSKQLAQIAHRNIVTGLDRDGDPETLVGFPVDVNDEDNEGSLLAAPVAGYRRNTVLTPKILRDIRKRGHKRFLVRSSAISGSPEGGVYARDVGIREFGNLPATGEQVGLQAAQALSEPIAQGQLSAKHTGGVAGESSAVSGFDYINQLVQVPKTFKGGASHSTLDGRVQMIEDSPTGGKYIWVDDEKHYVAKGFEPNVKAGDNVEAGDVISDGTPNPAVIVKYKGIGEGKRYFIHEFHKAMKEGGMRSSRRNIELLARGLINHVRLTDEIGDFAPDDVVPYSTFEHSYKPREGFQAAKPLNAVGKYLERPYLHYSIGTKIKPSMIKDFDEFGVKSVDVHDESPPFEPEMIRGMANLQHDPDTFTRMFGSNLKGGLLKAVHRGGTSDEMGTSFVPSKLRSVDFGRSGLIKPPKRDQG